MKIIIIGIHGKAYSGKSTLAKFLLQEAIHENNNIFLKGSRRIAFAKELKKKAKELGWNGKKDNKGRKGLQLLGTNVVRNCFNEDHWVNKWRDYSIDYTHEIEEKYGNTDGKILLIIADDMRFLNETDLIKNFIGIPIKIIGEHVFNVNLKLDKDHQSETELDNFNDYDYIIDNTGNIGHLYDVACEIIDWIKTNVR